MAGCSPLSQVSVLLSLPERLLTNGETAIAIYLMEMSNSYDIN